MLRVSETFLSIQGESGYAGKLCFFIRLAGCNLDCSYCDTRYANEPGSGTDMSVSELVDLTVKSGSPLVEITGGEPLLSGELPELCEALLEQGFKVLVETNGSLPVDVLPSEVVAVIDCKTPSSGHSEDMCLANFISPPADSQIKFVIGSEEDYGFAVDFIEQYELSGKVAEILYSPVAGSASARQLCEWMIRDKSPARMQLQLHKYIWSPDTRGV